MLVNHAASNVVQLHVTEAQVNAAWTLYDEASRALVALTQDLSSDQRDRWQACLAAERARVEFRRLYDRWLP